MRTLLLMAFAASNLDVCTLHT